MLFWKNCLLVSIDRYVVLCVVYECVMLVGMKCLCSMFFDGFVFLILVIMVVLLVVCFVCSVLMKLCRLCVDVLSFSVLSGVLCMVVVIFLCLMVMIWLRMLFMWVFVGFVRGLVFELLCEVYEFVDFCVGFVVCDCFVGELDVVCD